MHQKIYKAQFDGEAEVEIAVPDGYRPHKIKAEIRNGILTLYGEYRPLDVVTKEIVMAKPGERLTPLITATREVLQQIVDTAPVPQELQLGQTTGTIRQYRLRPGDGALCVDIEVAREHAEDAFRIFDFVKNATGRIVP